MAMYIMKGLCVIGIILNVFLMWRKDKELRANPEKDPVIGLNGEEQWQEQKKHMIPTAITGFVANFLDTLGIGSFAPSSAAFKLTRSVDDVLVPGTLNVGDTVPVCVEAFLFFGFVEMDVITLVLMLVASVAGSILMASIVSKFDRKKVRYTLFIGLFILATVILMKVLGVGPFGTVGTELGLSGIKLVIAVVGNFIFGALMSIGVGLYAPCMATCLLLGVNPDTCFPVFMGSCACLMPACSIEFIKTKRYDVSHTIGNALGGCIGVFIAWKLITNLPMFWLINLICVVLLWTSYTLISAANKDKKAGIA